MGAATLTTICVSMVILGVGLSAAIVPSMADMVTEAKYVRICFLKKPLKIGFSKKHDPPI